MKTRTSRASVRRSGSHRRHSDPIVSPAAHDANRNALLDMIELLDEERRRNEYRAFSSQDAPRRSTLEIAARRCATTISDMRRRLAPAPGVTRRLRIRKRQVDAYLDTMLDTCFVPRRTGPVRGVLDGGMPSASTRRAAET